MKLCTGCEKTLPLSAFRRRVDVRGRPPYSRCRGCESRSRRELKRRRRAEGYEQLADACEVCGSTKDLCADHDHATGQHRGTLCNDCNLALGWARDDVDRLRGLAAYLDAR